jgi:hypothetical protein
MIALEHDRFFGCKKETKNGLSLWEEKLFGCLLEQTEEDFSPFAMQKPFCFTA